MKKVYERPTTDIVVLNLGEPVAWGEGANASNTGQYTDGKENDTSWDYIEEEDELDSKFAWSVWGDDEDEEEDY
jgi:hypothetical protein